ncbi:caffeoylshikimate esterase-like protein isoform X1 [Cinnamomum micranthum f. kanehirae]|uniref:Caffeoylshikimate esterase-like protein isoform X1 n=1 Tax=Cinnamomum micranthum f. kanehirae TaxID=337451 RepID=A0A3S3P3N8_9MAGN|nr:caffeoylshikimate esterase-like protein isoform X1 [Cinnamomum micranthum f. kanehirae]
MEISLRHQNPVNLSNLVGKWEAQMGGSRINKIPIWKSSRMRARKGNLVVAASKKAKKELEGVSDELNAIAAQNKDSSAARRRVRSAFTHTQQQLDHLLFKVPLPLSPPITDGSFWRPDGRGKQIAHPSSFLSYVVNSRGLEIFSKKWFPSPEVPIKGALFFCHGYGDTCTFFFEGIAKKITASGYGVYAMDYPGFGLSDGLHGYIPSFDEMVDDVVEHYTNIKGRPEARDLPHFIFGQSMGGAVALKVHLKQPQDWDGVVLVAPMCKIAEDVLPPAPVLKLLTLMSKVLPQAKLFPQKDLAVLAFRDSMKRKMAYYNVIAYSDQMRLKTAVELLKTTRDIESQVEKVCAPLLVLHGAADKVTDPLVSKFLYEKANSKDKTLKLYEEGYHSILEGEPDDRILEVLDDIISWLDSQSALK